jgi:hypothetical protein
VRNSNIVEVFEKKQHRHHRISYTSPGNGELVDIQLIEMPNENHKVRFKGWEAVEEKYNMTKWLIIDRSRVEDHLLHSHSHDVDYAFEECLDEDGGYWEVDTVNTDRTVKVVKVIKKYDW